MIRKYKKVLAAIWLYLLLLSMVIFGPPEMLVLILLFIFSLLTAASIATLLN